MTLFHPRESLSIPASLADYSQPCDVICSLDLAIQNNINKNTTQVFKSLETESNNDPSYWWSDVTYAP